MVAKEGSGKIPGYGCGQPESERAKPPLPGSRQNPETTRKRSRSRDREGHHYRTFFSMPVATGPAAMKGSCGSGEVRCKGSVRKRAGVRWSASGSGSGAGIGAPVVSAPALPDRPDILFSTPSLAYIQPVSCDWSFTNWSGAGSISVCATSTGTGGFWLRSPQPASRRPSWWWPPPISPTVIW